MYKQVNGILIIKRYTSFSNRANISTKDSNSSKIIVYSKLCIFSHFETICFKAFSLDKRR